MARTRRELVAQYLRLFLLIVDSLTAVRELASVYIGYRCVTYGVSSVFLKLLLPTLRSIANLARRTIAVQLHAAGLLHSRLRKLMYG